MSNIISAHIRENSIPSVAASCNYRYLKAFTSEIDPQAAAAWPLNLSEAGFKTVYTDIASTTSQAGLIAGLVLKTTISDKTSSYELTSNWQLFDGQLTINIDKLQRLSGNGEGKPFAGILLAKMQNFILIHDKESRLEHEARYDPSLITLEATSNNSKASSRGGYVWALQGFDFAQKEDLQTMQTAFRAYAAKQGVALATADMKHFKYPFHFAVFDCGIKVRDKFGQSSGLGKAFMLLSKWPAVWRELPPQHPLNRFAKAYNSSARQPLGQIERQAVLEPVFRKMMCRYTNKYTTLNSHRSLSVFKRYAAAKLKKLLSF